MGKTRHIQTGLLWIQQTAAEQRLKFNKILGKNNPADLFTKHLDERTNHTHTKALGYKFTAGRAEEAPKLHIISKAYYHEDILSQGCQRWKWLKYVDGSRVRKSPSCAGEVTMLERYDVATCSRSQVLQGYKWRVQGSNGSNAAQLSHPWGPTRTFQHSAGVSWELGLRHGVTMHPRGGDICGKAGSCDRMERAHTRNVYSSHHINDNITIGDQEAVERILKKLGRVSNSSHKIITTTILVLLPLIGKLKSAMDMERLGAGPSRPTSQRLQEGSRSRRLEGIML